MDQAYHTVIPHLHLLWGILVPPLPSETSLQLVYLYYQSPLGDLHCHGNLYFRLKNTA